MSKRKGPNRENLEQTRQAFLTIARQEFSESGYVDASTNRIVERSGMARGSLYYHFGDKYGLFKAVYIQMMEESYGYVSGKMDVHSNPKDSFFAGCDAFLDLCMKPEFRKIVLIESQSALSYLERMLIHEETFLGRLRRVMGEIFENRELHGHTRKTATIFIFGILSEAGRSFEFSTEPEKDRADFAHALRSTIHGLMGNEI